MFESYLAKVRTVRDKVRDKTESTSLAESDLVCATFEILIPVAVKEDVGQILYLLSFMQSQRFHIQILVKAILNPQRQINADKNANRPGSALTFLYSSWSSIGQHIFRALYEFFERLSEPPALPQILRSLRNVDPQDVEYKLRELFGKLRDLSLIDYNE